MSSPASLPEEILPLDLTLYLQYCYWAFLLVLI